MVVTAGVVILTPTALISAANGTASGFVASGGQTEYVMSGGVALGSLILGNAFDVIQSGGIASGVVVSGGREMVSSGGLATAGTVSAGFQFVYTGGSAIAMTMRGGTEVLTGGHVTSSVLSIGGSLFISSGGIADFAVVSAAGGLNVLSGGTAQETIVTTGGAEFDQFRRDGQRDHRGRRHLHRGQRWHRQSDPAARRARHDQHLRLPTDDPRSTGERVRRRRRRHRQRRQPDRATRRGRQRYRGARQRLRNRRVAWAEAVGTVLSGGTEALGFFGNDQNTNFDVLSAGGSASGTIIDQAGVEIVYSSTVATGTTINSGGYQLISSGGLANGGIVTSSGFEVVSKGGTAFGVTVQSGGIQVIYPGGSAARRQRPAWERHFVSGRRGAGPVWPGPRLFANVRPGAGRSPAMRSPPTSGSRCCREAPPSVRSSPGRKRCTPAGQPISACGAKRRQHHGVQQRWHGQRNGVERRRHDDRSIRGDGQQRRDRQRRRIGPDAEQRHRRLRCCFRAARSVLLNEAFNGGQPVLNGNTLTVSAGGTTFAITLAGNYTGDVFSASTDLVRASSRTARRSP